MTDQEYKELLLELASRYRIIDELAFHYYKHSQRIEDLRRDVKKLSSICRRVRVIRNRVIREQVEIEDLYRVLRKEYKAPTNSILEALRELGILRALDETPEVLYGLRESVIPKEDLELLLWCSFHNSDENPKAGIGRLISAARGLARTSHKPSKILQEAASTIPKKLDDIKAEYKDAQPPKKRKILNGIGNILMGFATGGGNILLAGGTIAAPNPATGYLVIGSAAVAIGAVFKGLGDLRGE